MEAAGQADLETPPRRLTTSVSTAVMRFGSVNGQPLTTGRRTALSRERDCRRNIKIESTGFVECGQSESRHRIRS